MSTQTYPCPGANGIDGGCPDGNPLVWDEWTKTWWCASAWYMEGPCKPPLMAAGLQPPPPNYLARLGMGL